MFLVGLTGNYGTGKSTVLKMFADIGAIVYDTDEIVASLLREKSVKQKIGALLGDRVFHHDGSLDKRKVAALIFADDTLRLSLENLLHPLVFEKINHLLNREEIKSAIVVVETPLLFERHYEGGFQKIITVQTAQDRALSRLENRGISRGEAMERIRSQVPLEEKISRSDFTINNNGTLEETEQQVSYIYKKLLREVRDGDSRRS
jgi:dephospho-CoA kinase